MGHKANILSIVINSFSTYATPWQLTRRRDKHSRKSVSISETSSRMGEYSSLSAALLHGKIFCLVQKNGLVDNVPQAANAVFQELHLAPTGREPLYLNFHSSGNGTSPAKTDTDSDNSNDNDRQTTARAVETMTTSISGPSLTR